MIITAFVPDLTNNTTSCDAVINIWSVQSGSSKTKVLEDTVQCDQSGWITYDFTNYDEALDYVVLIDFSACTLTNGTKFYATTISPTASNITKASIQEVTNAIWDEQAVIHTEPGSFGLYQNQMQANTENIVLSIVTLGELLNTLKKFEQNRTKIDPTDKTLTIYDNDNVTPLHVFDLKDSRGAPSVAEVAERVPKILSN